MKEFDPIAYKKMVKSYQDETNLLVGLIVSTLMRREIIELFSGQILNPILIF